jgi:hypothetical protein
MNSVTISYPYLYTGKNSGEKAEMPEQYTEQQVHEFFKKIQNNLFV